MLGTGISFVDAATIGLLLSIAALTLQRHGRTDSRTPKLARLEAAVENRDTYDCLARILTCEERLSTLLDRKGLGTEFFLMRVNRLRLAEDWRALADGRIKLSADEEYSARVHLADRSTESIVAVSYDEADFWRSVAGTNFLNAQRLAHRVRRVRVRRYFITPTEFQDDWDDILQAHHDAHVEVYVVDPDSVCETDLHDFNIYDDQVVRFRTGPLEHAPTGRPAENATFSVREDDVVSHRERVNSLAARSTRWLPPASAESTDDPSRLDPEFAA